MEAEIRALLQEGGVSFKQNSKSFVATCCRCQKKDKLYIRRKDGRFVCWYCRETEGFQGLPEFCLAELCGLPMGEVRKRLYGDNAKRPSSLTMELDLGDWEDEDLIDLPALPTPIAWPYDFKPIDDPMSLPGLQYLEGRGIPKELALEYSIRYNTRQQRVVFPVMRNGNLYGWQERLIANDKPYWDAQQQKMIEPIKTFTSLNFQRDRWLMFGDRLEGSNHCVMTEGPVDGLKAHLCGGNVVTMGKAVSPFQLELIRNSGVQKVYLGLDPDAYLELDRIRKKLADLVLFDLRAPGKDLGEMSLDEVKALFDSAPEIHPGYVFVYLKNFFGD